MFESKMASLNCVHLWSVMAAVVVFSGALVQSDKIPTFSSNTDHIDAAVGSPVTIYCSITDLGRYQVFWNIVQNSSDTTTEEFTLGPFRNTHASYPRFKIVGDVIGEYNLRISDVVKSDAGMYICLVHDTSNVMTPAMEFGVRLTVQDSPMAPMMAYPNCERDPLENSQTPGQYIKGDMLQLTCTSQGGVPLAELSWEAVRFNGGKERLRSKTQVVGDVVTSTASIELSSLDHQSYYECTEEHPSRIDPRTCKTPFTGTESFLDVRFKPEVELRPDVVIVKVLETVKVTLSCTAYGNPALFRKPEIILPVGKNGSYPHGALDKTLVEVEMTVDDVGKDFYCRAENEHGVGNDTLEVRQGSLPTWLVLVIIGSTAVVILFFIILTSCILCVDRSKYDDPTTRPSSSRPTSLKKDDDLDNGMIPIEEFQGGQESANVYETDDKTTTNDFETGEAAGPRYQNVNEAFQQDEMVPAPPEPDADFVPVDLS